MEKFFFKSVVVFHVKILAQFADTNREAGGKNSCVKLHYRVMHLRKGLSFTERERKRKEGKGRERGKQEGEREVGKRQDERNG